MSVRHSDVTLKSEPQNKGVRPVRVSQLAGSLATQKQSFSLKLIQSSNVMLGFDFRHVGKYYAFRIRNCNFVLTHIGLGACAMA